MLSSHLRARLDSQGQKRDFRSVRDGPSGQGEEAHQDHAPRAQPHLEREVLLVSFSFFLCRFSDSDDNTFVITIEIIIIITMVRCTLNAKTDVCQSSKGLSFYETQASVFAGNVVLLINKYHY